LERELARFEAVNAQVLGISVDSVWSHIAFADSLGGLSYPLLSDFHPHGEVTQRYGLWRPERGNGKRAVFIIDPAGIIRWAKVYERGLPEIEELLGALAEI
jgi:alkyl hydroperoxide reductase subunit AhpC